MAPHSSTHAWKIPWMEESGRLQSMGSRRVRQDWATSLSCTGEGNGNPLQCSCLENPKDGGAWWAAVYGITQSHCRNWKRMIESKFLYLIFFLNLNGIFLSQHVFKRPTQSMAMPVVNSLLLTKGTSTEIGMMGTSSTWSLLLEKQSQRKLKVWEDKFSKQFSYRRVSDSVSVQSQIKFWDTGHHSSVGYWA